MHVAPTGEAALAWLGVEDTDRSFRPDLVILDWGLPLLEGRAVLTAIRSAPHLRGLPVVVLTGTTDPEQIRVAQRSHADAVVCKPDTLQDFQLAVQSIAHYWLSLVVPTEPSQGAAVSARSITDDDERVWRILVLESNPSDWLLIRSLLEAGLGHPHDLEHHETIDSAVSSPNVGRWNVIVTGLCLPENIDDMPRLRQVGGAAPILVLTDDSGPQRFREASRLGADDCLDKEALTADTLGRAVHYALQRQRYRDKLRVVERRQAVTQLAGSVAHDFNNLLTVIHTSADAIGLGDDDDELRSDILDATERGAELTRRLLRLGRDEPFSPEPFDLDAFLQTQRRTLARVVGSHVEIELRPDGKLPLILADAAGLEQVLLNLVTNATDAMPNGGRILISTRMSPTQTSVQLEVEDEGTGIPPEVIDRVQEPFFTTKTQHEGSGLGLSSVDQLLRQHGGSLIIRSTPGAGTTVTTVWPIESAASVARMTHLQRSSAPPPDTVIPPAKKTPTSEPKRTPRVLVVDDEASIRKSVERMLRERGFDVVVASSVVEALVAVDDAPFDLLLTDLSLGRGETGFEAASAVRDAQGTLPVLYMSGLQGDFIRRMAELVPGENFINKPFTIDALERIVRSHLTQERKAAAASS